MTKRKRSSLFVDPEVQGAIQKKIFLYAGWCMLFITIPLFIALAFIEPDRLYFQQFGTIWYRYWPIYVTLIAMLPFFIYDTLRLTNRFVGPVFRLRRELRRFAEGGDFQPIRFRGTDFWNDLAVQFNHLVERVKAAEKQVAANESTEARESSSAEI